MSEMKLHETSINDNNNLIKWINDNHGFIHPDLYIDTKFMDNTIYRSIHYKNQKRMRPNDTITKIPHKLVISENTFEEIPNINRWTDIIENSNNPTFKTNFKNSKFRIMMALLFETTKKENSFYFPYIKLLPTVDAFDNHPINIYNKENNAFKILESISQNFMHKIASMSEELNIFRDIILFCNKQFQIFDENIYSDFQLQKMSTWSYFIQKTRSWGDKLIPFDDIFNHSNNSDISLKNIIHKNAPEHRYYIFKTDNQFNNNENSYEIFIHYGFYHSMIVLMDYDFMPKNSINYLIVPFNLNTKNDFEKLKIEEIKKCNLHHNRILLGNNGPSKDLFTILRALSLTKSEYNSVIKSSETNKFAGIISNENELKSVRLLLKLVLDLKKSTYTIEHLNTLYSTINKYENRDLTPTDLIIKNVCLITIQEYKIIEDSLYWINDMLSKIINNSNILNK